MLPAMKRFSSTWIKQSGKILVTTQELQSSLQSHEPLVLLDASWHMPNAQRNAVQEHQDKRIPTAQFFDIDSISDPMGSNTNPSQLPHQLPTNDMMRKETAKLGVLSDDVPVVVYDSHGMFSCARVWFMLHAYGHRSVYLLDGGLPLWEAEGRDLMRGPEPIVQEHEKDDDSALPSPSIDLFGDGSSTSNHNQRDQRVSVELDRDVVRTYDQVLDHVRKKNAIIVDARSERRFYGKDPEPRPNLRSGHIPTSKSLPFTTLLTTEDINGIAVTRFHTKKAIRDIVKTSKDSAFGDAGEGFSAGGLTGARTPVVATCGSGVTACVVAAGMRIAGFDHTLAVYDGSWSEWGSREDPEDVRED